MKTANDTLPSLPAWLAILVASALLLLPAPDAWAETPAAKLSSSAKNSFVPASAVEFARKNLDMVRRRYDAAEVTACELIDAEYYLKWAEAMLAGDRLAAMRARREGLQKQLVQMRAAYAAGGEMGDIAATERQLAEAEVKITELQREQPASAEGTRGGAATGNTKTKTVVHYVPQSVVDAAHTRWTDSQKRAAVGTNSRADVQEAESYLRWTEAMFAGDPRKAAEIRRESLRSQIATLHQGDASGSSDFVKIAQKERELAEAEVAVAELQLRGSREVRPQE